MKANLYVPVAVSLAVLSLGYLQARADDDGIAARAIQAQAALRTPPPTLHREPSRTVRTSEGTLIHPKYRDAGVDLPLSKPLERPQQEDYHVNQMY